MFHWDIGPITVDCEVVHTMVHRRASAAGEKNTFHTGLRVLAADRQSEQRLRELVHVFSSKARPKPNGGNGGGHSSCPLAGAATYYQALSTHTLLQRGYTDLST